MSFTKEKSCLPLRSANPVGIRPLRPGLRHRSATETQSDVAFYKLSHLRNSTTTLFFISYLWVQGICLTTVLAALLLPKVTSSFMIIIIMWKRSGLFCLCITEMSGSPRVKAFTNIAAGSRGILLLPVCCWPWPLTSRWGRGTMTMSRVCAGS